MSKQLRTPQPKFKVVLLGNVDVGKTSIWRRIRDGVFRESDSNIVHTGIEFTRRDIMIDDDKTVPVSCI